MLGKNKASMVVRLLKERLQKRLPAGYVLAESADDQGALLLISQDDSPVAGEQVIALRVLPSAAVTYDLVGQKTAPTPLRAQVIEEESSTPGRSIISLKNQIAVTLELVRAGLIMERYMTSNGTPPALSMFQGDGSVSGANLAEIVSPELYLPGLSS